MWKIALIIPVVFFSSECQAGKVSAGEIASFLKAVGETTADFEHCGASYDPISDAIVNFVDECAASDSDQKQMMSMYHSYKRLRTISIREQGASCQGDIDDRLAVFINSIKSAQEDCK